MELYERAQKVVARSNHTIIVDTRRIDYFR